MMRLLLKKQIYTEGGCMLSKLMKELDEMNRLSQVYHREEQWVLLEMIMSKINTWSEMIGKVLERQDIEVRSDI